MREQATQFGPGNQLAGVLSHPAGEERRRAACVLVTAGVTPKFGPFRLYTLLARALAAAGYPTLRFDIDGVGESPPQSLHLSLRDRTALEVSASVSHACAAFGAEEVILGGLCSGATDTLRHALLDQRIRGVVLMDPFSYETRGSRWRYNGLRAVGRVLKAAGIWEPIKSSPAGVTERLIDYQYMEHHESSDVLSTLLQRGTQVHFVYTGAMRERMNHRSQVQRMFPGIDFQGRVTVTHFPRMEHTQYLEEDREALVNAIVMQVRRCHPSKATDLPGVDRIAKFV